MAEYRRFKFKAGRSSGEDMTPAIKVLVELCDGLTPALYQTYRKRRLRPWNMGEIQMQQAKPNI